MLQNQSKLFSWPFFYFYFCEELFFGKENMSGWEFIDNDANSTFQRRSNSLRDAVPSTTHRTGYYPEDSEGNCAHRKMKIVVNTSNHRLAWFPKPTRAEKYAWLSSTIIQIPDPFSSTLCDSHTLIRSSDSGTTVVR